MIVVVVGLCMRFGGRGVREGSGCSCLVFVVRRSFFFLSKKKLAVLRGVKELVAIRN